MLPVHSLSSCFSFAGLQARAAEQALASKLQQTPQWQQMRQLLQEKSQEVMQLRKQLAAYQPQDVPSADATGGRAGMY
jgi:hypothetical protein